VSAPTLSHIVRYISQRVKLRLGNRAVDPLHHLRRKRVGNIQHNPPHPVLRAASHTARCQTGSIVQIFHHRKHAVLRFAGHVRLSIQRNRHETLETASFAFCAPSRIVTVRFSFRIINPTQNDRIPVTLPVTLPVLLHIPEQESTFFKIHLSGNGLYRLAVRWPYIIRYSNLAQLVP
jgi:hypothetical protein